jgi:hypothetical protein
MKKRLELDNCLPVAQLVRALHRNRRAADLIPASWLGLINVTISYIDCSEIPNPVFNVEEVFFVDGNVRV